MLILAFRLGQDRYALPAKDVVLLVPAVSLRELPQTPDFVAGVFQFKNLAVPVVDMQMLTKHEACSAQLSTRIILTNYTAPKTNKTHVLGLMAEDVTEAFELDKKQIKGNEISIAKAPYLSDVASDEQGMIQLLDVHKILPNALQETLFVR